MHRHGSSRCGKGSGAAWAVLTPLVLLLVLLILLIVHAQTARRPHSLVLGRWVLGLRRCDAGRQPARGTRLTFEGGVVVQTGRHRLVGSRMEAGSYLWFTWTHITQ